MSTIVDVRFRLRGSHAPALHAHALYGAICEALPACHEAPWLGIHTLHGRLEGDQAVRLYDGTRLALRVPAERIPLVLGLVGRTLDLRGHKLVVGVPDVQPLAPAPQLSARMVIVKGFLEPEGFEEACRRQLVSMEVGGELIVGPRLVQPIHGRKVVGFGVRLEGLTDAESLVVQREGIGGRRRFGCGLFRPVRARQ